MLARLYKILSLFWLSILKFMDDNLKISFKREKTDRILLAY
jgi:hypothetical protein